jgi:hypothetical protein
LRSWFGALSGRFLTVIKTAAKSTAATPTRLRTGMRDRKRDRFDVGPGE